ncbi:MAG: hypothetical protein H0W83_10965 [Planctomycetes bacterium]|nr:hypothetical protein [Planctomycetota bacterium]
MEWDGKIEQPKPACAATGRVLAPGETYYSGLRLQDGVFTRTDVSSEAWPAQDQASFLSWWRHAVPETDRRRRTLKLDKASLGQIFADLKDSTERPQQCFCYVVALCLARMRAFRLLSVITEGGASYLLVQDRLNQAMHRVRDPKMSTDEEEQVRKNLFEVIGTDGASVAAPSGEGSAD